MVVATGTPADMLARLKTVLPSMWFADETPVLDGLLAGFGSNWSKLCDLLQYVGQQTRIATITDCFLDIAAADYFGSALTRRAAETDGHFRGRIQRELLRERATRSGLISAVTDLTGRSPAVFEPSRPADTGAWNGVAGYGAAGAWGSLMLPFQCLVTAFRPQGDAIGVVGGWGQPAGGWGQGAVEYASLSMLEGQITDTDITDTIAQVMPVAAIAWTRIVS